jgi:hypothetical protein
MTSCERRLAQASISSRSRLFHQSLKASSMPVHRPAGRARNRNFTPHWDVRRPANGCHCQNAAGAAVYAGCSNPASATSTEHGQRSNTTRPPSGSSRSSIRLVDHQQLFARDHFFVRLNQLKAGHTTATAQITACLALRKSLSGQDRKRLTPTRRGGHLTRLNSFRPSMISSCSTAIGLSVTISDSRALSFG